MLYLLVLDSKVIEFDNEAEAYAACDRLDEQKIDYVLKVAGEFPEFDGEHWY